MSAAKCPTCGRDADFVETFHGYRSCYHPFHKTAKAAPPIPEWAHDEARALLHSICDRLGADYIAFEATDVIDLGRLLAGIFQRGAAEGAHRAAEYVVSRTTVFNNPAAIIGEAVRVTALPLLPRS